MINWTKVQEKAHYPIHSQILLAAASGDVRALQRWWLQDIDLNVGDYDGRTPLHVSSAEGHLECVRFLVETCRVNPNPKDRCVTTYLRKKKQDMQAVVLASSI